MKCLRKILLTLLVAALPTLPAGAHAASTNVAGRNAVGTHASTPNVASPNAASPNASTPDVASPVVIELFTSQGCSSCPPADALLGELARRPNVVALSWHVGYWDELGWKDRFSIPASEQRQAGYVRRMSSSGAFTPQAVIGGDTSVIGSDRKAIDRALAEPRDALAVVLSRAGSNLRIDLPERWREPLDVCVISYLAEATTQVGRGENAHRALKEYNIVRSFQRLAKWDGTPRQLTLPLASIPADATAVATVLQRPGSGAIAGVGTLALR
jgi:hypothetical protein